jgi:hypothetical protein
MGTLRWFFGTLLVAAALGLGPVDAQSPPAPPIARPIPPSMSLPSGNLPSLGVPAPPVSQAPTPSPPVPYSVPPNVTTPPSAQDPYFRQQFEDWRGGYTGNRDRFPTDAH